MGFFSTLKNNLTGSWADVTLQPADGSRGDVLELKVHVHVRDEPIEVSKVAVKVRCVERVTVPESRTTTRAGDDDRPRSTTSDRTVTTTLFDREIMASPAVHLEAGSDHEFVAEVSLPEEMPPTVTGRNARFEWQAFASLDMKGNDPDSGWQTFRVW